METTSAATLANLLVLGSNSSFDSSKLSTSTITGVISHIKTLKRNNITLDEQTLTINTEYMLDRLIDKKGNLLNDNYKRQIGMTIKRIYPNADIPLNQYKKAHNESRLGKNKTRASSDEFMNAVRILRDATLNIISDVYSHERVDDLGQYDSCIATLLTLCTSLRIEEVRHLKLSHIQKIRENQPIGIKSKQSYATRVISNNNLLESTFNAILKQRNYIIKTVQVKKADYATQYQQNRITSDYIIISTADYMRKKLHEIAAASGAKFESLGFNVFRKLTTSVLIEGGGFLVAQTMNNHRSLNTTLEHYNMKTSKSVQQTYDALAESIINDIEMPQIGNNIETILANNIKSQKSQPPTNITPVIAPLPPPAIKPSKNKSPIEPLTSNIGSTAKKLKPNTDEPKSPDILNRILSEIEKLKSYQQTTMADTNALKINIAQVQFEIDKKLTADVKTAADLASKDSTQIDVLQQLTNEYYNKLIDLEKRLLDTKSELSQLKNTVDIEPKRKRPTPYETPPYTDYNTDAAYTDVSMQ